LSSRQCCCRFPTTSSRAPIPDGFRGIPPVPTAAPWDFPGSALQIWDFATPAPPLESVPPGSPIYGDDPHGAARNVPGIPNEVSQFLRAGGAFVDACGPHPCAP
jgi:hypothetical protein